MADEDLNTDSSEEDKAEEAAAEKAFLGSFKANEGNREGTLHVVGGGDSDEDDDTTTGGDGDDSVDGGDADDDQGDDDDDDADDDQDDQSNASGKGKPADKAEAEPTIKDVIAMVQGMQTTIQTNVTRQVGGMLGRLEKSLKPADVKAATTAAADTAKDQGKKVPSKERVDKAMKSVANFADMEKDFPDYVVLLRESLTTLLGEMDAEVGTPAKPLDENAVVDKAVAKIRQQDQQSAAARKAEEAEYAKIDGVWPAWKTGINDAPFKAWKAKKESGPDGAEYQRIFKEGSTRETISVFQEFSQETGTVLKKDGTQSAGKGNQSQASNKNDDRRKRSAHRPRGSASAPVKADSEEDAFQRSFNERRGG